MTAKGKPTPDEVREAAIALIQGESTLTLATAGESGPWSAPVYYVYADSGFYFFSSPHSRHIEEAMLSGKAAASLFRAADSWQAICGIQMQGTLERVHSVAGSLKVIAMYLKRFSFARQFFPGNPSPDLESFFSRFRAHLYAFKPTAFYYIDNRFGLGTRQRIDW